MFRYALCFFLLQQVLNAQVPQHINYTWDRSLGHREFSSRDVLQTLDRDSNGNLWLVGSTETDSTFSDILVQQLDTNGNLLWSKSYSTNYGYGYDVPLQCFLTPDDDLLVLCESKTLYGTGIGYILKINQAGTIEWVKDLISLVGNHDYSNFFYGFLDGRNILRVTYSTKFWDHAPSQTYFMGIRATGEVIDTFSKNDISQPNPARHAAISVFHDASDYFIFPYFVDTVNGTGWHFRKIHPILQEDYSATLDVSELDTFYREFLKTALSTTFIKGPGGDYHTWEYLGNLNGFWHMRLDGAFKAKWVYLSTDRLPVARFDDLLPMDSFMILAGHQESFFYNDAFLWKMKVSGEIIDTLKLDLTNFLRPTKLWQHDQLIYLSAEHRLNKDAFLFCLDTTLEEQWVHAVSPHENARFQGNHLLFPDESHYLLGGRYRLHQMADSAFATEEDFGVMKYSIGSQVANWQYTYNGTGTSGVYMARGFPLNDSHFGLISYEESPFAVKKPANRCTFYHIDADGQVLWESEVPAEVTGSAIFHTSNQDDNGNIYLPTYYDTWKHRILRYSQDGTLLDSLLFDGGITAYLATRNGEVFVSSDHKIIKIPSDFSQPTEYTCEGIPYGSFQLPYADDVFTWSTDSDSMFWNKPFQVHMYKNGQHIWTQSLPNNPPNIANILAYHQQNGRLLYLRAPVTAPAGTLGLFALDGTVIGESSSAVYTPQGCAFLQNGNFYLLEAEKLTLFDSLCQPIQQIQISSGYHKIFSVGNWLYDTEAGQISVYDAAGNLHAIWLNNLLDAVSVAHIDSTHQLWQVNTHGQFWYSPLTPPNAVDWKWRRVRVRKYDLSETVNTNEQLPSIPDGWSIYPSPVVSRLTVECKDSQMLQAKGAIEIASINGQIIESRTIEHFPEKMLIETSGWPSGWYMIRIKTDTSGIWVKKICVMP